MSTPLRSRKRLETRQGISNAATRLFRERGFERVTVDDIAAAAEVGRMTVFNHFPRKEDMFFDRDEEGRALLRDALRDRDPGVSPVETYRRLAHRLVAAGSPVVEFSVDSQAFMATIAASVALQARARAIRDEVAQVLAGAMAESVGRPAGDSDAQLAAGLILATWAVGLGRAHQIFRERGNAMAAKATFLMIVDKGMRGVEAGTAGTPYSGQSSKGPTPSDS